MSEKPKIPSIRIVEKRGAIVLDWYFKGERRQRRIGPPCPETMTRATREKIALEVLFENGEYEVRKEAKEKRIEEDNRVKAEVWRTWTFKHLADQYLSDYVESPTAGRRGTGLKDKRCAIMRVGQLCDDFGPVLVTEVTQDMVEARKSRRARPLGATVNREKPDGKVSGATVNREHTIGKHIFNWAIEKKRLPPAFVNPFRGVKKCEEPDPLVEFFETEKEAEAVLAQCPEILKKIAIFARNVGMRRKELLTVCWSQVKKRARIIQLRPEQTKSGKARAVGLNDTALAVLASLPHPIGDGPLFIHPKTGRPVKPDWVTKNFKAALTAAGVTSVRRYHGLRHDCASQLVMQGKSLEQAGAVLGHLTPLMTQGYAHLAPGHLIDVVRSLDSRSQATGGDHLETSRSRKD